MEQSPVLGCGAHVTVLESVHRDGGTFTVNMVVECGRIKCVVHILEIKPT